MKRGNIVKLLIMLSLIFTIAFITGCKANKTNVKTAQINSIINNKDSFQENAFYNFDNGNLDVNITFSPFQALKEDLPNKEYDEKMDEVIKKLNKEFPNENIDKNSIENSISKTIKNVTFSIQEKNRKVIITGKNINMEFSMSESNENRLIDNQGNEYELHFTN